MSLPKSHGDIQQFVQPIRRRLKIVIALIVLQGAAWLVVHHVMKGQRDAVVEHSR